MKNSKRGDVTIPYLVTGSVIVILGLIIMLSFLGKLNFSTADETCKFSVLSRATLPNAAQGYVPLKCTTHKTCLTVDDKECKQFAGEKDVNVIKLPSDLDAAAKVIERTYADGIYSCWNLMGQGKLDLFSGSNLDLTENIIAETFYEKEVKPVCVICSRVALSSDLAEREDILSHVDVNEFMVNNKPEGQDRSYYKLLGGDEQIGSYAEFNEKYSVSQAQTRGTDEIAFLFGQILTKNNAWQNAFGNGFNTGVVVGSAIVGTPIGKVVSVVDPTRGVLATLLATGIAGGLTYSQTVENRDLSAIYCGGFTSNADKARQGCSVIRSVNYQNISQINSLCLRIEGMP